jgi:hypothetical protein
MAYIEPGECKLTKLNLIYNETTVTGLLTYVNQFDIFESIRSPVIKAVVAVRDTSGALDNLIIGIGQQVEIEFTTNEKTTWNYIFTISSIEPVITGSKSDAKYFLMNLCSKDYFVGTNQNVTEVFSDMESEKMIGLIMNKYIWGSKSRNKKRIKYETTKGIDTISFTSMNPYQAVDKIRRRAVSRRNKSSSFCFFERVDGYVFSTIEELIAGAKTDPSVRDGSRNFFLDNAPRKEYKNTNFRTILAMEQVKYQDAELLAITGALSCDVWSFCFETGLYNKKEFRALENDGEFKVSSNSFRMPKNLMQEITSKNNPMLKTYYIDTEREQERVEKEVYLRGYVSKLLSNMINIKVFGSSELGVGDVIHLNLPVVDSRSVTENSEVLSGDYIITKVRHMITPQSKTQYFQSYELLNTGFLNI